MPNDYNVSWVNVQGKSHKKSDPPIPCQDSYKFDILENGINIAIVSDGAGSSTYSHFASAFSVTRLLEICKSRLLLIDKLLKYDTKIEEEKKIVLEGWNTLSKEMFDQTRADLLKFGEDSSYLPKDLHCTLILVIKTPFGFLSANIGDGRAGYYNGVETKPLIVPFMTFTAGATFFLIKEGWENIFRSYAVFDEHVDYFFASSDGCQEFIIDASSKGPKTGVYDNILGNDAFYDLNKPFHPFFEGVIKSLKEVESNDERNERLRNLIENGIYSLNGEEKELKSISDPTLDDDKTFVFFYK